MGDGKPVVSPAKFAYFIGKVQAVVGEQGNGKPKLVKKELQQILAEAQKLDRPTSLGRSMVIENRVCEGDKTIYFVKINGSGTVPMTVSKKGERVGVDVSLLPRLHKHHLKTLLNRLKLVGYSREGKVDFIRPLREVHYPYDLPKRVRQRSSSNPKQTTRRRV